MFSRLALPILLSLVSIARADPNPQEPGPNQVFQEGKTCHIAWTPDASGTWTSMAIELMTGDNLDMIHLTTVTTVDGTKTSTFDLTCPDVTLYAPVYFYQFSIPSAPDTKYWTTRFAISDASGKTVAAPNSTQPTGEAIAWGTGALANPSIAVAAPSYLSGTSSGSTAASGSSSSVASSSASSVAVSSVSVSTSVAASASASPTSSSFVIQTVSKSSSSAKASSTDSASAAASATAGSASSQTGAAPALYPFASRVLQTTIALTVVAGTFVLL
ncbi:hypothetical protein EW146_g8615 [Bondarzewia mesenterica]|uniref:Uncharacterized protein n=1 Tax=Bondarzewia mesenterica TaxID=1095465 RepID=A0A4S4LD16_9AGAM|nr:hypothetical protein EW146_g8615 [Bondarzewia mesenterica]